MDEPMEVFLYLCDSCGTVTGKRSEEADAKPCKVCLVGSVKIINFVAQHEGRVRVKLEMKS